jgi:hypothetical protein
MANWLYISISLLVITCTILKQNLKRDKLLSIKQINKAFLKNKIKKIKKKHFLSYLTKPKMVVEISAIHICIPKLRGIVKSQNH